MVKSMDKVNITEILAYTWICPQCGAANIQDKYTVDFTVICEGCMQEFEVGEIKE